MPCLNLTSSNLGPLLEVRVGVSELRRSVLLSASRTIPPPVIGTFLVDSGASSSAVDSGLLRPLGLQPSGALRAHTPSTLGVPVRFDRFDVQLFLRGSGPGEGLVVDPVAVMATSLSGQGIDGLIGRDILDRGVFHYNGRTRTFLLAF